MSTATGSHQFHQRIKELVDEDWIITFGPEYGDDFNPYVCGLFRSKTTAVGHGGNPLSALYDAEANLKEPVSKSARDQLRRASH